MRAHLVSVTMRTDDDRRVWFDVDAERFREWPEWVWTEHLARVWSQLALTGMGAW